MNQPQIYIARAKKPGCSWLKIGASREPEYRMKGVHSPGNVGAELLRVIEVRQFWRTVEKGAHARLSHRQHWREWFDVSLGEALWAIYAADKDHYDWMRRIDLKRIKPTSEMSLGLLVVRRRIERADGIVYWQNCKISEESCGTWPLR